MGRNGRIFEKNLADLQGAANTLPNLVTFAGFLKKANFPKIKYLKVQ
ncbi:MAG: hypothetical protein IPM82_12785 [Saprospiraceae bacterium]|nr:hypothetical protein [Saprospiraceae bacterium]